MTDQKSLSKYPVGLENEGEAPDPGIQSSTATTLGFPSINHLVT